MSQPASARAPGPAGQQEEGLGGKIPGWVRSVAMFMVVQAAMKYGMSYMGLGGQTPAPPSPIAAPDAPDGAGSVASNRAPLAKVEPYWPLGTPLSMLLYTFTSEDGHDVDFKNPLVTWDGLEYGRWSDVREVDLMLDVPQSVRSNNGSWFMDILLVKGGGSDIEGKGPEELVVFRKQLTRFLPKRRVRKVKKLIGNDETDDKKDEEEDIPAQTIVAHWSSNLTLTTIASGIPIDLTALPAVMLEHYKTPPNVVNKYYPPVYPNDFWLLRENLYPINETSYKLPLHLDYHAISQLKFQIFSTMTASFEHAATQQGTGAEIDEVKRMLTETSPWLLITTTIVTLLHALFEFLAFSSDIGHWRKKDKDLVGVSLRTILTNCFVQLVILLYLQDSSEQTSFMILAGQGIGLVIEAWKITKVVNIRVRKDNSLIGYSVTFEDKKELSEEEKRTQEYDKLAFRLVSYFAIPALACYTGYSLLYETHRGWYSFVVTTLAQAIYMFGFVQLVPQLIINYKLKSVAHMPLKAMMFKTLSTVVDDFFAFCIKMPWLHRLACFRDDVVFVILLYQRWIYRVDYSRVNEYGQVNEGMVEPVGPKGKAEEVKETKKTK